MERLRGPDCEAETVSIMNSEIDRKSLNPRAISHVLFFFVEAQQRRFITFLSSFFLLISISNRNCDRVRSSLGGDPSSVSRQTAIAFLDAIGDRTTARASPSTPRPAGRAHSLTHSLTHLLTHSLTHSRAHARQRPISLRHICRRSKRQCSSSKRLDHKRSLAERESAEPLRDHD
jgi:hypothetical protein